IVGGVIISLALLSQVLTNLNGGNEVEGRTSGLIILYVVGSVTMVIAILGAYGAHRESKVSLIVDFYVEYLYNVSLLLVLHHLLETTEFLVCMVIGSLLMLRAGIPAAAARPKLEGFLENAFREKLPLDKASYEVKNIGRCPADPDTAEEFYEVSAQKKTKIPSFSWKQLHCCGLFSYKDWEDQIPDSCECNQMEEEGKCQTINYGPGILQQKSVYIKTCFPIILHYALLVADIVIGVIFVLAVLALLGMILSSIMIHQLRYPNRPTVLLSVPAIFTTPPPKYQELHNPPQY
ncbi:hypothetical protein L3Q82_009235, partial [Scortum barcoo]